jgi:hypothetical protein
VLTLFSIPNGFDDDERAQRQYNAMESWRQMQRAAEVIVFGDDPGVAEAAAHYGFRHQAEIGGERGVPFVSEAFRLAPELASNGLLCYTNADMIYVEGLAGAVEACAGDFLHFLAVGRRWNVGGLGELDFRRGWQARLRKSAEADGYLDTVCAIDWFAFRSGTLAGARMPRFLVGSPGWDNWLIRTALDRGVPVVDATETVFCVHQKHGKYWPQWGIDHNRSLQRRQQAFTADATWKLKPDEGLINVNGLAGL